MNELLIFDLDNTFYNYQPTHEEALNSVFNKQNQYDKKEFIKNLKIIRPWLEEPFEFEKDIHKKLPEDLQSKDLLQVLELSLIHI